MNKKFNIPLTDEQRHKIRNVVSGLMVVIIIFLGLMLLLPGLLITSNYQENTYIKDNQQLLSWSEEAKLIKQLKNMSDDYGCYVSIVTAEPANLHNKVFEIQNLERDGLRIGISTYGNGEYRVFLYGTGEYYLSSEDRLLLEELVSDGLVSYQDIYTAIAEQLVNIEKYVFIGEAIEEPEPNPQDMQQDLYHTLGWGLIIGIIFAGITIIAAIAFHNQKHQKVRDSVYIRGNEDQYGFTVTKYDVVYLGKYEEVLPDYYATRK